MKFTDFVEKYPNYSTNRFSPDVNGNVRFLFNGDDYNPYDKNGNLVNTVYEFPSWRGETPKPENIHDFLNVKTFPSFPKKYTYQKADYTFIPWNDAPPKYDYTKFDIYVQPQSKVELKLRNIFTESTMTFKTAKEAHRWLGGPNLSYWSQQLNFAVWCATGGCGIGRDLLTDTQVGSLMKFHVIFTVRRILNELQVPLPQDSAFKLYTNTYNKSVYEKLRNEFNTPHDFRFLAPINHGLGYVYAWGYGGMSKDLHDVYVPYKTIEKLPDEFEDKLNQFSIVKVEDERTSFQYEWFFPLQSKGFTKAGLSRLNQTIESFVYCILGSQVNTRSAIVSNRGSAMETQQEFLVLFEDAIIERDISKSIRRYQQAIQEAKVKLDFAISPGCWLLPSNLVINTTSIVGYNNKLLKATKDMSLGVNNINSETKHTGIRHNNMSHSKIQLPHQNAGNKPSTFVKQTPPTSSKKHDTTTPPSSKTHDINLAMITIVAAGFTWYIFR